MNTNKIYAESIVNQYSKKEDSKVVRLKKLDRKVKKPARTIALVNGILSTLLLGIGMCFSMQVIGPQSPIFFIVGITIGCVGIAGCTFNYFLYKKLLIRNKEKYAGDIIELAKQIAEEE